MAAQKDIRQVKKKKRIVERLGIENMKQKNWISLKRLSHLMMMYSMMYVFYNLFQSLKELSKLFKMSANLHTLQY